MSKSVCCMIPKTDTAHCTMVIFVITNIAGGNNTEAEVEPQSAPALP